MKFFKAWIILATTFGGILSGGLYAYAQCPPEEPSAPTADGPDLVITSMTINANGLPTVTFRNQGNQAIPSTVAGRFYLRAEYLDANGNRINTDAPAATHWEGLAVGASATKNLSSPGSYWSVPGFARTISVKVDSANNIIEAGGGGEDNNISEAPLTAPDLVITSITVDSSTNLPTVIFTNQGTQDIQPSTRFDINAEYLDEDGNVINTAYPLATQWGLAVGMSATKTLERPNASWVAPPATRVRVKVDSANNITEYLNGGENNNTRGQDLIFADLVITSMTVPVNGLPTVTFRNQGNRNSTLFHLIARYYDANMVLISTDAPSATQYGGLNIGSSASLTLVSPRPSWTVPVNARTVRVTVDSSNMIPETPGGGEDNNNRDGAMPIPPAPDLVITSMTVGSNGLPTVTFRNQGTQAITSSGVVGRFYLIARYYDANMVLISTDAPSATQYGLGIGASATKTLTRPRPSWTVPVNARTVRVTVDSANNITEMINGGENNNTYDASFMPAGATARKTSTLGMLIAEKCPQLKKSYICNMLSWNK